jgi:methyltransferase-like protein
MSLFHAASPIRPVNPQLDPRGGSAEEFQTPDGLKLSTPEPLVKAALLCLAEAWPRSLSVEVLLRQAKERLRTSEGEPVAVTAADRQMLGHTLLNFYASASTSLIELYLHPPRFAVEVGACPLASPLARLQAERGSVVTNLRHQTVTLGEVERHLLRFLDGKHDRKALSAALEGLVGSGELTAQSDGQVLREGPRLREVLGQAVGAQLPAFAQNALLLA